MASNTSNTSRTRKNGPVTLIKADPATLTGATLPADTLSQLKAAAAARKAAAPAKPARISCMPLPLSTADLAALEAVGWSVPYTGQVKKFEPKRVSFKESKYSRVANSTADILKSGAQIELATLASFVHSEVNPGDRGFRNAEYILQAVANWAQIKVVMENDIISAG